MSKRKLKDLWYVLKARHYAVLTSDSEQEINWALETLKKAHAKHKVELL